MSDSTQEEAHTGPIKTPKQLLLAVLFAFVVPVLIIIGLVAYVVAENKPSGSTQAESQALGGVTAQDTEKGVAERVRKVGVVEIRDANRPLRGGEDVFKAQCTACHTPGAAGAPKLGDAPAWAARIRTGFDALVQSALKGKGAMAPQGGGDFNDTEIARAVAYMANAGGAKFAEPSAPRRPAPRRPRRPSRRRLRLPPPHRPCPRRPLRQPRLRPRRRPRPQVPAARPCTSRPASPATPPVPPTRPSSATRPPGRRASSWACRS